MKVFVFQFCVILLVSCGSPERSVPTDKSTLSFSLDTVMVNPAGQILFLNGNLSQSFLSTDRRYLYNFNHFDYTLEKIDLEMLRLVEKIPFEKEGPNGIGANVHTVLPVNSDSLYFGNYTIEGGIFTWDGKKVIDSPLNKPRESSAHLSGNEQLSGIKSFSDNSLVFYGLIKVFDKDEYELAKIDTKTNNFIQIPTPLMDRIRPFKVTFIDGPYKISVSPAAYLVTEGGKVILSTGSNNELFGLDQVADTLQHYVYESQIIPSEKSGKYRNEVSSQEEMYAVYREIRAEINYEAPFWDQDKELFYRFSYQGEFDLDLDRQMQDLTPDKAKVYLTIYDKNLDQIDEALVPKLDKVPAKHFAKDGKIWMYINLEDELGFLRLTVDF